MKQPQTQKNRHERGNVLFMILAAVALFAALGFAMTQSSVGDGDIDREEARVKAMELLQYGGALKEATKKLMLVNQCSEGQLSFEADWNGNGSLGTSADQENTTSPSDFRCHYFHENGADVPFVKKFNFFEDSEFEYLGFRLLGTSAIMGFGSDLKAELIFAFRLKETEKYRILCNEYNKLLNLPYDLEEWHDRYAAGYFSWGGGYNNNTNTGGVRIGDGANELHNQPAGCFKATGYGGGGYMFYYTLLKR